MEIYDKYSDEHRKFTQDGNCHLIFNLDTNPLVLDEASKWIDHLLDEDVLQGEGGEPLLDVSKFSKEIYAEILVKFINRNKGRNNDNIDLNTPEVERDNLTSTFTTEGMAGPAQMGPMQRSLM